MDAAVVGTEAAAGEAITEAEEAGGKVPSALGQL